MSKTLRVKLDPLTAGTEEEDDETNGGDGAPTGAAAVGGAVVGLVSLGAGSTLAKIDPPKPAKLRFLVRFFERARDDDGTEPEELAAVDGTISLSPTSGAPAFIVEENSDSTEEDDAEPGPVALEPLEDPSEPETSSPERRQISLAFDAAAFTGIDELTVALPKKTEEFAFAEVLTELSIDETVEATFDQNDVLDVPITKASPPLVPAFEVRVVDEIGEPVDGLEVGYTIDDERTTKQTDEDGVARFFDTNASVAELALPAVADLKSLLKPRWDEVRGKALLAPSAEVQVSFVNDDMETTAPVEAGTPLVISLQPRVERARLLHFFFDTNKTFILPDLPAAAESIAGFYARNTPSKLLIVGHADTAGSTAYNDQLSFERAEAVLAYLKDDVDGWLKWYDSGVPRQKRWGEAEDLAMIGALPDHDQREDGETPVEFFQRTRGLKLDGIAGPETRRALIEEYMGLDGASLPAEIEPTLHGVGEHFPETTSADGQHIAGDRRVDLFFFDPDLGIQPPPPGKNSKAGSKEYPEWVRRAAATEVENKGLRSLAIKILDALNDPLANAPYELTVGDDVRKGHTDQHGFLVEQNVEVPNRCTLKWGYPPGSSDAEEGDPELFFTRQMLLDYADVDDTDRVEAARRRLSNLGYVGSMDARVQGFQRDFGLPIGALDQPTFDEIVRVHDRIG